MGKLQALGGKSPCAFAKCVSREQGALCGQADHQISSATPISTYALLWGLWDLKAMRKRQSALLQ